MVGVDHNNACKTFACFIYLQLLQYFSIRSVHFFLTRVMNATIDNIKYVRKATMSNICYFNKQHSFDYSLVLKGYKQVALSFVREAYQVARVLVIDDEIMIGEIATRILKREGHEVVTALNGNEAVSLVDTGSELFDVVVIDESMPGLSARETIQELVARQPGIATIISSGYKIDFQKYVDEFGSSIMALPKPYRSEQLAQAVIQMLKIERTL